MQKKQKQRLKFTKSAIERLLAPDPDGKQVLYWDTETRGFGVLCSGKTNTKTYVVQRDLPDGRTRRVSIGPTNVLDLDKARDQAGDMWLKIKAGTDPKAARAAAVAEAAAAVTLQQALDAYLVGRKDLRGKTRTDYKASITGYLAPWLARPLRDITPDMVEDRLGEIQVEVEERAKRAAVAASAGRLLRLVQRAPIDRRRSVKAAINDLKAALAADDAKAIRDATELLGRVAVTAGVVTADEVRRAAAPAKIQRNGNATANGAMRALRAVWNWQIDRSPGFPAWPTKRLKKQWHRVERREGLVRAHELPAFYAAVNGLPSPIARDYLLLLLFTGLRRTEAASLTWDDIDFADRVIRLPAARTKAGRRLDLPMSTAVRTLLVGRRALGKDGRFVFPGDSASGHIAEPRFPLAIVAKASGVHITAHDLRRTFITVAESTEISVMALKALVNHSTGGDITAGYVQMSTDRLREAAQRVCDKMMVLCGVAPVKAENVETL